MRKKIIDYGNYKEVITTEYNKGKEWYQKATANRIQMVQQKRLLRNEFNPEELQYLEQSKSKQSATRAKKTFRELILCNVFDGQPYFINLTYDKDKVWTDEKMLKEWNAFRKRFKRAFDFDFKYLMVPEKHAKGDYHFHFILFDGPSRLDYQKLLDVWGNGAGHFKLITKKRLQDTGKMANYLAGYLTDETNKEGQEVYGTQRNKKAYFPSRNLKRPSVITDSQKVIEIINDLESDMRWSIVGDYTKHTAHNGMRTRKQYIITE